MLGICNARMPTCIIYSRVVYRGDRSSSDATALWFHDAHTDDASNGGVDGRSAMSTENVAVDRDKDTFIYINRAH